MNRNSNTPRRAAAGLLLTVAACVGCGQAARPSDPGEGLKALRATLDAWKGGESPGAVEARTPSIHASDGDWMAGLRLQGYQAIGEGRLVGSDIRYAVALELKDARGRLVKKDATYAVTTHPRLLVLRQDD